MKNKLIQLVTQPSRRLSFFALFFVGVFFVLKQQNSTNNYSNHIPSKKSTDVVNATYISPLCNCSKEIQVQSIQPDPNAFKWCGPDSSVRGMHQKVITYTLYGNVQNASIADRYYSLLRNISLTAERDYPGWVVRIYHNFRDQEGPGHQQLCDIYCQFHHVDLCSVPLLIERIGNSTTPIDPVLVAGLNPKMFRYLVMLDPNVDVFISRDVDSIIWPREVDAVAEWLKSNYTFHVMRDHPFHGAIILAGMWGAKLDQRRDLIEGLMRALVPAGQNQIAWQYQVTLDTILWPTAKYDVMAHDSYQCQNEYVTRTAPLKVFPFPTQRAGKYYVGGAGGDLYPEKCPEACRPPDHKDWEYC
ncbi:uncharacterized protein LOC124316393 [Daphnia pulicaria]|uniref:uncharacterized protein LOC124316393 n=1 Tax=Daphnia pulicaria TaxID=35523 RepID=UPI001EE9BBF2|nr:uncharacterized protein LOC124316393 [Daphnia pulicaria]